MCGVVGYTGTNQAAPWLLDGLQTLEYRGYDSAGIQVVSPSGNLRERAAAANPTGSCGIGHTRWATHGAPTDRNAHPHLDGSGRIAVVHNGIIENFQELRRELTAAGHTFVSDTDTEVIPHLIQEAWEGPAKGDLAAAVRNACDRLEGSWAVACICADLPGTLVCTRKGSPLVVAFTEDGAYAASDVMPLAGVTSHVLQLDDYDVATLTSDGTVTITFTNNTDKPLANADQLVDRLYTTDSARTTQSVGLGLSIVQSLTTTLGGKMTLQADRQQFAVTLTFRDHNV